MGYKFKILEKGDSFCFALYPGNSNHVEIGISTSCDSCDEAKKALDKFRGFIKLRDVDDPAVCIKKQEDDKYTFEICFDENGATFYRQIPYWTKDNCKKGIRRIFENIDAPIKN